MKLGENGVVVPLVKVEYVGQTIITLKPTGKLVRINKKSPPESKYKIHKRFFR